MAILTIAQLKEQIGWTSDLGSTDDAMLTRKIDAAQGYIERLLGYKIADRFGGEDQDPVPPELVEAVSQLAAYWYGQSEAASDVASREVPFGVREIANEFRDWSF